MEVAATCSVDSWGMDLFVSVGDGVADVGSRSAVAVEALTETGVAAFAIESLTRPASSALASKSIASALF